MTLRTITTPYPRARGSARLRPRWVLVYCALCERWISEESRHPCEQAPDLRAARLEARKVKQMEVGIRDYD